MNGKLKFRNQKANTQKMHSLKTNNLIILELNSKGNQLMNVWFGNVVSFVVFFPKYPVEFPW